MPGRLSEEVLQLVLCSLLCVIFVIVKLRNSKWKEIKGIITIP